MTSTSRSPLLGIACAIAGYLLFSAGDVMAKYMRQFDYSSAQISFQYASTAVVLLLLASGSLGGLAKTFRTQRKGYHLLRGLVSAPTQAFNFYAFSKMPMANVYAVIFLAPFLTAGLAGLFVKERISPLNWLLIGLGFVGVLTAMRPDIYGFSLPVLAVLVSALFASIRNITVPLMGPQETPLSLALFPASAIVLATAIPAWHSGRLPDLSAGLLLSTGGLFYACGLLLTCLAFRFAPAAIASPFHYTQILWAMLAGVLFFGDFPDGLTIMGSTLIIVTGVGLIRLQSGRTQQARRIAFEE